jgi:hypothetical protein
MSNDTAQLNLREPEQTDWDAKGSTYAPPPPVRGSDGKPIIFYGVVKDVKETDPDDGYLNYILDPITLVRSGQYDGTQIRFTRASVKPFQRNGEPLKGNPNKVANFLRSVGGQLRPQTNADYRAAVKASVGKPFPFIGEWEAYNKDTQEAIRGFLSFPEDPERPGQRKSILKKGDVYNELDAKGNIIGEKVVQSEILFANLKLKYFQDAAPKVTR